MARIKETELQRLARIEEEGPFEQPLLSEKKRKQIENAARQWANKSFSPYDYSSGSAAKADVE